MLLQVPPGAPLVTRLIVITAIRASISRSLVRSNAVQLRTNVGLIPSDRGIVIDGKDTDSRLATFIQDLSLAGKHAVAIDASIAAWRNSVGVGESSGCRVVDGVVVDSPTSQAGLYEWRVDAALVGQGCNEGSVDRDTVSQRQDSLPGLGRVDHRSDDLDGELCLNGRWVWSSRCSGLVDPLVRSLL